MKLIVFVMLASLLAAACNGDEGTSTPSETGSPAAEGARTLTVNVDGEIGDDNVALLGYFPREVTARQGDTVEFAFQPGDPHTVTFGTLVDQAFAEMAAGDEPATFEQIPPAFDDSTGSLVATGTLPCFSAEAPPLDGTPCQGEQTDFAGTDAFYSSGLLAPPEAQFSMTIAADATPGTYNFFCLLHGPDMSGSVTVVAADGEGQTAADVDAARQTALDAVAAAATPVLEAQATGVQPGFEDLIPQGDDQVLGGGAVEEPVFVDILKFGPEETTIAAGESVTFNMIGFHTVSFNVPQDATPLVIPGEDGLPMFNPLAMAPQGGATGAPPPPEGGGPTEEPTAEPAPQLIPIDGGTFDGTGFFSSGVLPSFPPVLFAWTVTFSTPGTYPFACLVHPGMEGTITVT